MSHPGILPAESLSKRFMDTALRFPERNAVHINGAYYSYRELSERVQNASLALQKNGAPKRIAIYCTNDVQTYVSILAVNYTGAAYIPLNPKFPVQRNKKIVERCKPDIILSSVEYEELKEIAVDVKTMNSAEISHQPADRNDNDNQYAYILFTSGSTGEPKGVPVSTENIRHFFNYFLKEYNFNEHDKFLQCYELTFDVSVFSFFMPLLVGACCYVLPEEGIKPMKIAECLKKQEISVVSMVPSVLNYLEKYIGEINLPQLRYSFFSGDALPHSLAAKWSRSIPNAALHNFYGPTETTIVCTRYIFKEERSSKESVNNIVPLGKAFEGMEMLIVDEKLNEVPKGELCFTGTQVISGYLNGSDEDRFFERNGKRYYLTGDIVSLNQNDDLVFYGRSDDQVKINGYRVELGEIKYAIERLTEKKVEVIFDKGVLIAFAEGDEFASEVLKEQLAGLLPDYMLPHQIINIVDFPLNVNGKTDKNKLLNLQK